MMDTSGGLYGKRGMKGSLKTNLILFRKLNGIVLSLCFWCKEHIVDDAVKIVDFLGEL